MRVLLVEDDTIVARGVSLALKAASMIVDTADTGEESLELARLYDYDIIILDLMLPDMEGYEVVRRLRASRIETPVLILSGLTRPQAKVRGFGMGADDYITKPFRPRELRARVEAMLRRPRMGMPDPADDATPGAQAAPAADASADDGWLLHRGLRVHPAMRIAEADGTELDLTRSEFDILADLMGAGRRVVSKSDLALMLRGERYVGGSDFVSDHDVRAIEVHVANLRRKLGESATQPRWIETIRGVGYRMTAAS